MKKKIFIIVLNLLMFLFGTYSYANEVSNEHEDDNFQKAAMLYKQGVELTRSKAYNTALSYFTEALSYNPEMTDAYYNIASIYVAQGRYDDAYNIYLKVIKLNPYDYDSILQVAKILYNRKNYALALKYLKYIPDDYWNYGLAQQLAYDAREMFDKQKGKIERSKLSTAVETNRMLIDKFNSPAGMAVDSEGNMYVACYADNSIVKIDKNKQKTNFVSGYLLEGPIGIAIDAYDNLYVANFDADNILRITKGGNVSIFMDKVSKPYFLYIKDDILYVSEQGNDVVLTYNLSQTRAY